MNREKVEIRVTANPNREKRKRAVAIIWLVLEKQTCILLNVLRLYCDVLDIIGIILILNVLTKKEYM
jgi:hypothetical protein